MMSNTLSSFYQVTKVNHALLIQMPLELSVHTAAELRQSLRRWIANEGNLAKVIFDFGHTTVLDSSGIGALVSSYKILKSLNIDLLIWGLSKQTRFVLDLAGLDGVFDLNPSTDAIRPADVLAMEEEPMQVHPSVLSKPKRLLDIAGALVGLAITGVILIPLAIAIKLDSRGPIFYSQIRCGLMGHQFRIWKFRSMVTDADTLKAKVSNEIDGTFFKNKRDPRVTRVGRFIRKTSLDEFPQFWNVLKGDMSLIGTRPPLPDEVDQYQIASWQRLNVKPGMSGEWQVSGRSNIKDFEKVIELDLKYQKSWSFFYDIHLILKTIMVLFKKDTGAY